jgi:hypothetical protein
MRELERKFAAAAAADGDVYLPNYTPPAPADAILIAMEPSLGWWARTPEAASVKIHAGFRNFMWSPEDFILHYAARHFLCPNGQTYHITDISKGAMTVARANIDRAARYKRWIALLREEVDLVAKPRAQIVAIGGVVHGLLVQHSFDSNVAAVMHYSSQASRSRNAAVEGRESEFRAFAQTLSMEDIVAIADAVMRDHCVPSALSNQTIARLRKATLSESRKKLAFIYATAFARLASVRRGALANEAREVPGADRRRRRELV